MTGKSDADGHPAPPPIACIYAGSAHITLIAANVYASSSSSERCLILASIYAGSAHITLISASVYAGPVGSEDCFILASIHADSGTVSAWRMRERARAASAGAGRARVRGGLTTAAVRRGGCEGGRGERGARGARFSKCCEQTRAAYNGAVFGFKKEIPAYVARKCLADKSLIRLGGYHVAAHSFS